MLLGLLLLSSNSHLAHALRVEETAGCWRQDEKGEPQGAMQSWQEEQGAGAGEHASHLALQGGSSWLHWANQGGKAAPQLSQPHCFLFVCFSFLNLTCPCCQHLS